MRISHPDAASLPELVENNSETAASLEAEVTALFEEYRGPVLRFLLSVDLPIADSEEIVQEVFLALFQHLRANKPRHNLRAWIFAVANNLGRRARRKRPAIDLAHPAVPTPEQVAINNQLHRRLHAVINALPEKDRACFALRAEGLRYREIAEVLGISVAGVALSLERALHRLSQIPSR